MPLLLISLLSLTESETNQIRSQYRKALTDESVIANFKTLASKHTLHAVGKAYYGTALALEARASWSPATKMSNAKAAHKSLNEAVKIDPANIEIRFLRLSFANGTPDFLEMKGSMADDKKILLQGNIKSHPINDIMQKFIANSGLFSAAEKSAVK